MSVNLYIRDDDGVRKVLVINDDGSHSGDENLWELLTLRDWELLEGRFDPTNEEHRKLLPFVLRGSRLWAALSN